MRDILRIRTSTQLRGCVDLPQRRLTPMCWRLTPVMTAISRPRLAQWPERFALWVPWGNMMTGKSGGLNRVGRLVLSGEMADRSLLSWLSEAFATSFAGLGWVLLVALVVGGGAVGGALRERLGSTSLNQRFVDIERRVGDVQDILLALSDDLDRVKGTRQS